MPGRSHTPSTSLLSTEQSSSITSVSRARKKNWLLLTLFCETPTNFYKGHLMSLRKQFFCTIKWQSIFQKILKSSLPKRKVTNFRSLWHSCRRLKVLQLESRSLIQQEAVDAAKVSPPQLREGGSESSCLVSEEGVPPTFWPKLLSPQTTSRLALITKGMRALHYPPKQGK